MSISQKSIQDRSFLIANSAGIDAHNSAVIDNGFTAELFFPMALRRAVVEGATGNTSDASSLKRVYPLTLAAGEVTLPATVVEECLDNSNVYVTGSESVLTSYEPRWLDYQRVATQYSQLAYYTDRGGTLCYTGAGGTIGTSTASINLVAVGLPDVPTLITDPMTINIDTAERVVQILAEMLRGKV